MPVTSRKATAHFCLRCRAPDSADKVFHWAQPAVQRSRELWRKCQDCAGSLQLARSCSAAEHCAIFSQRLAADEDDERVRKALRALQLPIPKCHFEGEENFVSISDDEEISEFHEEISSLAEQSTSRIKDGSSTVKIERKDDLPQKLHHVETALGIKAWSSMKTGSVKVEKSIKTESGDVGLRHGVASIKTEKTNKLQEECSSINVACRPASGTEIKTKTLSEPHVDLETCRAISQDGTGDVVMETPSERNSEADDRSTPLCPGHGEPCQELVVQKEGPNKGRKFFACSRSRDEQCKFFAWADRPLPKASSSADRHENNVQQPKSIAVSSVVVLDDDAAIDGVSPMDVGRSEEGAAIPLQSGSSTDTAVRAPLCPGHQEPCREVEVQKDGPNKGRKFFACPRPRGEQCNFFAWADRPLQEAAQHMRIDQLTGPVLRRLLRALGTNMPEEAHLAALREELCKLIGCDSTTDLFKLHKGCQSLSALVSRLRSQRAGKTPPPKRGRRQLSQTTPRKRTRPASSKLSRGPSRQVSQRIERALQHRLFLIRSEFHLEPPSAQFVVLGHTGNAYDIDMGPKVSCTCADFTKGSNNVCKHLLFVMIRVLGLERDDPRIWRRELPRWDRAEFCNKLAAGTNLTESVLAPAAVCAALEGSPRTVTVRLPSGMACPVCFEPVEVPHSGATCCASCGRNFHFTCITTWRTANDSNETCPTCRERWVEVGQERVACGAALGGPRNFAAQSELHAQAVADPARDLEETYPDTHQWITKKTRSAA